MSVYTLSIAAIPLFNPADKGFIRVLLQSKFTEVLVHPLYRPAQFPTGGCQYQDIAHKVHIEQAALRHLISRDLRRKVPIKGINGQPLDRPLSIS